MQKTFSWYFLKEGMFKITKMNQTVQAVRRTLQLDGLQLLETPGLGHSTKVRRETLRSRPNHIRLTAPLFSPSRPKWGVAMETYRGPSPRWPLGQQSHWRGKRNSRRCQSRYFCSCPPPQSPLSPSVGQSGSLLPSEASVSHRWERASRIPASRACQSVTYMLHLKATTPPFQRHAGV